MLLKALDLTYGNITAPEQFAEFLELLIYMIPLRKFKVVMYNTSEYLTVSTSYISTPDKMDSVKLTDLVTKIVNKCFRN